MRYPLPTIVLALSAMGVPSFARAQLTVDPVTTTGISGYRGSVTWLAAVSSLTAMNGVEWDEHSDKPCTMGLRVGTLTTPAYGDYVPGAHIEICGGNEHFIFPLTANSARTVQLTRLGEYVRGIQVCTTNANNHRLKGIRLYSATVAYHVSLGPVWPASVSVTNVAGSEESTQANCATWNSAVYCPANQIASALVVHHTAEEIVGLALRCRGLTP